MVTSHSVDSNCCKPLFKASRGFSKPGSVSANRDAVEFPSEELRLPLAKPTRLADPPLDARLPGVVARGLLSGTLTPLPGLAGALLRVAADCCFGGGEMSTLRTTPGCALATHGGDASGARPEPMGWLSPSTPSSAAPSTLSVKSEMVVSAGKPLLRARARPAGSARSACPCRASVPGDAAAEW